MAASKHLEAVRAQYASVDNFCVNVEIICSLEKMENELAHLKRVVGMIRRKLKRCG